MRSAEVEAAQFAYRHNTPMPLHIFHKRKEKFTFIYLLNTIRDKNKINYKFQKAVL